MALTLIEVSSVDLGENTPSVIQTVASFPSDEDIQTILNGRDPSLPPFDLEAPIYYYITGIIRPGQNMIFKIQLFQS